MRDVKTWLIIGLTVVIVLLILFQPSKPDPERQIYIDSVKVLQSQKAEISSRFEDLRVYASNKAISDSVQLRAQEREITRLKVKASQARTPKVDTLILDNPELKVFVEAQDSVIHQQSVLIDTLKNQLRFERNVREQLVALHYDSDKISASLQELSEQRIVTLEKDLKKERRKGWFLKAVAIVGSVAAFIGGSQL